MKRKNRKETTMKKVSAIYRMRDGTEEIVHGLGKTKARAKANLARNLNLWIREINGIEQLVEFTGEIRGRFV